jgi:ferredoxin-NADP reductase
MAGTAISGRLNWQSGVVVELIDETPETRSIVLELPDWTGHLAGQHVDVRLTADDGYEAQRSYSIASAPEDGYLLLTVQRLRDGEVSTYLHDELRVNDPLELRGPIGGYFVWDDAGTYPTQLIAGGSGIVPFRSMLRHRAAAMSTMPVRLLYSARSSEDLIYRDELMRFAAYDELEVRFALTRTWPAGWRGHRGRVNAALLEAVIWPPSELPLILVCGPTGFVEAISEILITLGHVEGQIRTERFGPT